MRWLRTISIFAFTLLSIEFLDEFVFGTREAAWPLIRDDLGLTYIQVGLLLSMPNLFSSLVEPVIGILGDVWRRRFLILGGGVVFSLALVLAAVSQGFWSLLLAFMLFYPASGAFVSLSQAALMDTEPERHEQNMARWTFAGSLGIVVGPLALGGAALLGWSWRSLFVIFALLALGMVVLASRQSFSSTDKPTPPGEQQPRFMDGVRGAYQAFTRPEVWRWLILLEMGNLMLDVLHGFLALYMVDVVGKSAFQAGVAVVVWTGAGMAGDFLLIPLLERVSGLRYLRWSAWLILFVFPAFLLVEHLALKLALLGLVGVLNAGWYAIPKGQLYSVMPGQSGTVMTVNNLFGLLGGLIPLGIGYAAQRLGLETAIWLVMLAPLVLLVGIPRNRSRIN